MHVYACRGQHGFLQLKCPTTSSTHGGTCSQTLIIPVVEAFFWECMFATEGTSLTGAAPVLEAGGMQSCLHCHLLTFFPLPHSVAGPSCQWPCQSGKWPGQSCQSQNTQNAAGKHEQMGPSGCPPWDGDAPGSIPTHPAGQKQVQWYRPAVPAALVEYLPVWQGHQVWWSIGHHGHSCRSKKMHCLISSTQCFHDAM